MPDESNSAGWTCRKLRRSHEVITIVAYVVLWLSTLSAICLTLIQVFVFLNIISSSTNLLYCFFSSIFHFIATAIITLLILSKLKIAKDEDRCILEIQGETRYHEHSRLFDEQLFLSSPILQHRSQFNSYSNPTPPPSYIESTFRTLQQNPRYGDMHRRHMTSTPRVHEFLQRSDNELRRFNESGLTLNRQIRAVRSERDRNPQNIEMRVSTYNEGTTLNQNCHTDLSGTTQARVSPRVATNIQEQNLPGSSRHVSQTSVRAHASSAVTNRLSTKTKRKLEQQNICKKNQQSNEGSDLHQSTSAACSQNYAVSAEKRVIFGTVDHKGSQSTTEKQTSAKSEIPMMLPNKMSVTKSPKLKGVPNFLPHSSPNQQLPSNLLSSIPENEIIENSLRSAGPVDKTTYKPSENPMTRTFSPNSKHEQGACGSSSCKVRVQPETNEKQHSQENTNANTLSEQVTCQMRCDLGVPKRLSNAERPDHANKLVPFDFESFKSTNEESWSSDETIS